MCRSSLRGILAYSHALAALVTDISFTDREFSNLQIELYKILKILKKEQKSEMADIIRERDGVKIFEFSLCIWVIRRVT